MVGCLASFIQQIYMNQQQLPIVDFQYPEDEDSFEESDDSELNPFQFELDQEQSKIERLETMYKLMLRNPQVDHMMDIVSDAIYNLKRLKKYALLIQKEHQMFQVLKRAYEELKSKTINHDQYIITLERAYDKQIAELQGQLAQLQADSKRSLDEQAKEIANLREKAASKQELLSVKDQEIIHIKSKEASLQQQVMNLSLECQKLQKELSVQKRIRTTNFLQLSEKSDFPYSTFELLITTKIKTSIVQFLQPKDILSLFLTKKSLYFALCSFRLLVPQVVRCQTVKLTNQVSNLTKQIETFKRLQGDCPEQQIKTQLVKVIDLMMTANDYVDPIMTEASNFIKGTQFLGRLEHIEDPDSNDGLRQFVQGMASRSQQAAQLLKSEMYPQTSLTQALAISVNDKESLVRERAELTKRLKKQSQDIYEKLFNLGTVVSADVALYGLYSTTMQRLFASLFVYSSQLQQECRLQLSVIYYMLGAYWQLIEKLRIMEQMNQDKQERLKNNGNEIKALYEQMRGLQQLIKEQQSKQQGHQKELLKEHEEKDALRAELNETKSLLMNYGKNIKLLALEIRELRKQNRQIVQENNRCAQQIETVKSRLSQINII